MSQRTKSSKAPAKAKPKAAEPAKTPTFDPDPQGGAYCGHYPDPDVFTQCTQADASIFNYTRGCFLPGEQAIQTGVYFGGAFKMACGGCGFVPEPYALYKLERHCIGQSDRGGCPAFMAKYHQQLHIFRPTYEDAEGNLQNYPYFRATLLPTFGLLTEDVSRPHDILKENYWLRQFKSQIDYNTDNKVKSRGFQFYRYPKPIPVLLPAKKVEGIFGQSQGIYLLSTLYEDHPSLSLMIDQIKARRRAEHLSEEDWEGPLADGKPPAIDEPEDFNIDDEQLNQMSELVRNEEAAYSQDVEESDDNSDSDDSTDSDDGTAKFINPKAASSKAASSKAASSKAASSKAASSKASSSKASSSKASSSKAASSKAASSRAASSKAASSTKKRKSKLSDKSKFFDKSPRKSSDKSPGRPQTRYNGQRDLQQHGQRDFGSQFQSL